MEVLLWVIYIVMVLGALALIALILMQKGSQGGGLGSAFGGAADTFFGKNKSKTAESQMQRWTKILGIALGVMAIALCLIIKLA